MVMTGKLKRIVEDNIVYTMCLLNTIRLISFM